MDLPSTRLAARLAALLAGALALAACASTGDGKDAGTDKDKAASDEGDGKKETPDADLAGKGKPALYHRIQDMTEQWLRAHSGSGEGDAHQAEALESAVAREVWARFDEVVEDLKANDNPRWRQTAARGLGFVHDLRVLPPLHGALGDQDSSVVAAALVSLARAAWSDTDDRKVAGLLTYPDKVVAGDAALCISRVFQTRRQQKLPILDPPARAAGIEADLQVLLFDGSDPIVRGNAAQALGQLDSPTAEDALLNRVRDDHPFVRLKVAQALALTGTPKGYDVLLDSLGREQGKNVSIVTALAIGNIAERQGLTPPYADLKTDAAAWRKWLKK